MKIFFKYITRCMMEKKLRFVLLIIAISLSTGMFVASMGAVNVGINSIVKPEIAQFEDQQIVISSNDKDKFFVDKNDIKLNGVKNLKAEIIVSAVEDSKDESKDTKFVTIRAREKENINDNQLDEGNVIDFDSNSCIISKRVSSDNKLKINDKVKTFINGKEQEYTVKAISSNEGVFYRDKSTGYSIIVPYKTLAKELKKKENIILFQLKQIKIILKIA